MKWLEFSGQELSKRPDMICQSGGHAGCSVAPLGLDQSRGVWLLVRQRQAQTHVRPGEVVEGLKVDHAPPHLGPILTDHVFVHPTRTHAANSNLCLFITNCAATQVLIRYYFDYEVARI